VAVDVHFLWPKVTISGFDNAEEAPERQPAFVAKIRCESWTASCYVISERTTAHQY
jgi:hypothetical protein